MKIKKIIETKKLKDGNKYYCLFDDNSDQVTEGFDSLKGLKAYYKEFKSLPYISSTLTYEDLIFKELELEISVDKNGYIEVDQTVESFRKFLSSIKKLNKNEIHSIDSSKDVVLDVVQTRGYAMIEVSKHFDISLEMRPSEYDETYNKLLEEGRSLSKKRTPPTPEDLFDIELEALKKKYDIE